MIASYSTLSLKTKITSGFGLVLLIAVTLGGLAVWSMYGVKQVAGLMVEKYVPEVAVANDVERSSLKTMYNVRGYAYTDQEKFLKLGLEDLDQVKKNLKDALSLAEKQNLPKLTDAASKAEAKALEYEKKLQETVVATQSLTAIRAEAEKAADVYMKDCSEYIG